MDGLQQNIHEIWAGVEDGVFFYEFVRLTPGCEEKNKDHGIWGGVGWSFCSMDASLEIWDRKCGSKCSMNRSCNLQLYSFLTQG